jgi:hypothetical protein
VLTPESGLVYLRVFVRVTVDPPDVPSYTYEFKLFNDVVIAFERSFAAAFTAARANNPFDELSKKLEVELEKSIATLIALAGTDKIAVKQRQEREFFMIEDISITGVRL